jgi:hypothetical protein
MAPTTLTPAQVEHDNFLRGLALSPSRALQRWRRLGTGDRLVVVTYMTLYYDTEFATHFQEVTQGKRRPDLSIDITNDPSLTPEGLQARGYKLQRSFGRCQVWAHFLGKELWLLPPPNAAPPPAAPDPVARPQALPAEHENVVEARQTADDFEKELQAFKQRAQQLKTQSNRPDYYALWSQFWTDWPEFQKRVDMYIDEVLPEMDEEMLAPEKAALQPQADRIKAASASHGTLMPWLFEPPTPPEAQEKMERAAREAEAAGAGATP